MPIIVRPLHVSKYFRFDTEVTLYWDLVCGSLYLIRFDFTLQQNLEIHKKMGMTDEQLEAYERQEREVCDLDLMHAVRVKPSKGDLDKRVDNGSENWVILLVGSELRAVGSYNERQK